MPRSAPTLRLVKGTPALQVGLCKLLGLRQSLEEDFKGVFRTVVFAITDWSEDRRFVGPFCRAFGLTLV